MRSTLADVGDGLAPIRDGLAVLAEVDPGPARARHMPRAAELDDVTGSTDANDIFGIAPLATALSFCGEVLG
jgi:hypothetical protein